MQLTILPNEISVNVAAGTNLLIALQSAGCFPQTPCGGLGTCGKCMVQIETVRGSRAILACQCSVTEDMSVTVPPSGGENRILTSGCEMEVPLQPCASGWLLAFDIGTTTVVCYLLEPGTGREMACASMLNPQGRFGADVITRIGYALRGKLDELSAEIRNGMEVLLREVCSKCGIEPAEIGVVSVVGNPCMQQLFLGIAPDNLAQIPFAPVLTEPEIRAAAPYLPACPNAKLLIVPDISGYIGADTIGCIAATGLQDATLPKLMVDIGTNGEMVLGSRDRLIACSTAAGPALEGARIRFGMRGAEGAIDHVWLENGKLRCSVIGNGKACGICGSGLIDACAVLLNAGVLNSRGRIRTAEHTPAFAELLDEQDGQRIIRLSPEVYLTQDDIREVQLAKGAIAAGIELMARQLRMPYSQISEVLLAGAFGSYIQPESACRIGLLPRELLGRIRAVGNAAGGGAKLFARNEPLFFCTGNLRNSVQFLELASVSDFQNCFARNMRFEEA